MATTASGVVIPGSDPSTTDATPIERLWNDLGKSLNGRLIVPVASITARSALITALQGEGYVISAQNPVYVERADAPAWATVEKTIDGATWKPVNAPTMPGTPSPLFGTYAGQPVRPGAGVISVTVNSSSIGTVALGTGYTGGLLAVTLTGTNDPPPVPRVVSPPPSANSIQIVTRRISDGAGTGAGTFTFAFAALGWD